MNENSSYLDFDETKIFQVNSGDTKNTSTCIKLNMFSVFHLTHKRSRWEGWGGSMNPHPLMFSTFYEKFLIKIFPIPLVNTFVEMISDMPTLFRN